MKHCWPPWVGTIVTGTLRIRRGACNFEEKGECFQKFDFLINLCILCSAILYCVCINFHLDLKCGKFFNHFWKDQSTLNLIFKYSVRYMYKLWNILNHYE